MPKPPTLQIEEISGDKNADLETPLGAALPIFVSIMQAIYSDFLEREVLVNDDDKIIPVNKEKT